MEQAATVEGFTGRATCPSCDCPGVRPLVETPFDTSPVRDYLESHYEGRAEIDLLRGVGYELDLCDGCGLVYQRTVPGEALLTRIYDHWIPESESERLKQARGLAEYRYLAEQVMFVLQHLRRTPAEVRVLDFGFGWAEWASMARAFGCEVFGSEFSHSRIEHARALGLRVVDWDDIPDHRFHFINTEQVFEHLVDPAAVLQQLASSLHPNGLIKISVPNGKSAARALRRGVPLSDLGRQQWLAVAPLEHLNCFDHASLCALGARVGLRPVRPSLVRLYNATAGWLEPRQLARNLVRPLLRFVYPRSTFVYFAHAR